MATAMSRTPEDGPSRGQRSSPCARAEAALGRWTEAGIIAVLVLRPVGARAEVDRALESSADDEIACHRIDSHGAGGGLRREERLDAEHARRSRVETRDVQV